MNWLVEAGIVLIAIGVLAIPGGFIAWILGVRGFTLLAAAAPFSMVVIAVAAMANVIFPFTWGIFSFVVVTLILSALAWAFRVIVGRLSGRPSNVLDSVPDRGSPLWPLIAVGIAVVCTVPRLVWVLHDPGTISQTFDNIYHLNAVEYVLQHGQIAPTRQLIPGFYPSAWHALTALVAGISTAPVPEAVNAVSIALGAFVWPVGIVFFTRQIVGDNRVVLLASGVLAAATPAFPLLMLDFGVLYPNVLSLVLLPSVLGILLAVAGLARIGIAKPIAWLMLLSWLAAMSLAHPSTLMAFFGLGFWPAAWGAHKYFRHRGWSNGTRHRVVISALLWLVGLAAAIIAFVRLRPTWDQAFWPPSRTFPEAIFEIFTNSAATGIPVIVVSAAMIAGIVFLVGWRRRDLWLLLSFATLSLVYIVGVAYPVGRLRYLLTGTWYSDMVRVAAILPVVAIPIAAIGAGALISVLYMRYRSGSDRAPDSAPVWLHVGVFVILAGAVSVTQFGPAMNAATASARHSYALDSSAALLSSDEAALLDRLDDEIPEDSVVVGSPWTGTSLSYALAERWALIPHIYQETTEDMAEILLGLNQANSDPAVCDAIRRTGATHVLDFGEVEVHGAEHIYDGLTDLESSDAVRLIDEQGEARLYEIIACR